MVYYLITRPHLLVVGLRPTSLAPFPPLLLYVFLVVRLCKDLVMHLHVHPPLGSWFQLKQFHFRHWCP